MTEKCYVMSRFNLLFEEKGRFYICNTLRGGLHEIDAQTFESCIACKKDSRKISKMSPDLIKKLSCAGYIVLQNADNEAINLLRYMKLLNSFQGDRLTLVIAPTLYCNFACPYCYEKNLPNEQMNDSVIEELINFIKQRQDNFKSLEICWHGGEPLVAITTIKKILTRIRKDVKLELKGHSIVTNGYLLNEKAFECFSEFPLGYIQITIDGNERTHNLNRVSKKGDPTFQKIICNIDSLTEIFPNTNVAIRMNVHKENAAEFIPLYQKLSKRWSGRKVNIYPAFVMNNQSCKVPCFSSVEKTMFLYELYQKIGKMYSDIDMKLKTGNCTAIYENSYVIDPRGNIFKCWVDVGVPEMRVGDVKNGIYNYALIEKYMLSSDKFTDEKCLKCCVFPICSGGCNKYRLDPSYTTEDICPISKEIMIRCFNFKGSEE